MILISFPSFRAGHVCEGEAARVINRAKRVCADWGPVARARVGFESVGIGYSHLVSAV